MEIKLSWEHFITEDQEIDNLEPRNAKVRFLKQAGYTVENQENLDIYIGVTKELINKIKELKENWKQRTSEKVCYQY